MEVWGEVKRLGGVSYVSKRFACWRHGVVRGRTGGKINGPENVVCFMYVHRFLVASFFRPLLTTTTASS